ncbi:MAG: prepilin-type N-terminal cleavage/methylation domain-containing protein [Thermotogae bacterium]|nr:prepilin-type N-terminal cleavage/methylation domain-containing protein [Thermotogota bacterium]
MAGSGFTIIELMVVVGIIASILVYIIPVAYRSIEKTRITNMALNMRNVVKAVEDYIYTEGSKMSKASETDLKWLDLNFLLEKRYLSSTPDGVEIDWEDSNISDGDAILKVKCTAGIEAEKLKNIWNEIEDENGTPVVYKKLAEYW